MNWKRIKRRFKYNRKRKYLLLFIIMLITAIGVGYAAITTNLSISGTSKFSNASWDVHFNNIQVKNGSITPTTAPTISNNTTVSFAATLEDPGDFYEFTIDVVNSGSMNAMIDSVRILPVLTTEEKNYFDYIATYSDGVELDEKHKLDAGDTETLRISFKYKELQDTSLYPTTDQNYNISVQVNYVQADSNAIPVPHPVSFADDSWETIIAVIKSGNTSAYHVGDTKTVELGNSLGTHTIRIANTSTPTECSTEGFSQTACGFVLEFADIITTNNMNSTATNVGGWPASAMRTFLNTETTGIYNSLPSEIKSGIIDTTVVSGHGSTSGEANFTSTDKLFLLSAHEVWVDDDENTSSGIDYYDTAYNNTRQLDYYANLGVTTSNYSGAIKQSNGSNSYWWLRSTRSNSTNYFYHVYDNGRWNYYSANTTHGVSPAFRIA